MRTKIFNPRTGEFDEAFGKNYAAENNASGMSIIVPRGEIGPQGIPGQDGKDGLDGRDGRDGVDGKDGRDGVDGKDGRDGAPGLKGDKGDKGDPGRNGVNGKNGVDGKANIIHSVLGVPKSDLGSDGDWCFNDLRETFLKKDGKWDFYAQFNSGFTKRSIIAMIQEFGGSGSVSQTITDGVTTSAPSEDAVFDALALKANLTTPIFVTNITAPLVIGSSSSGGTLTLNSTSHATKGKILLGATSAFDEVNNWLGLGVATPGAAVDLIGPAAQQLRMSNSTANTTLKLSYITQRHYNTAEEDVSLLIGTSSNTNTTLRYGGGSGSLNAATEIQFYTAANTTTVSGTQRMTIDSSGRTGLGGLTTMTALLHIAAGSTAASSAPLKFTSGSLQTTAEAGAVEFLTDDFYATITTGAARKKIVLAETSGAIRVPTTGAALVAGNATLVGGTVTVNTTAATSTCLIMLTRMTTGGVVGNQITYTISAGTSFTINSNSASDTSTFSFLIVQGI